MANGRVGRPKGLPKTGGRKKGSPNRATRDVKEAIRMFVENNIDEVQKLWESLPTPGMKLQFFTNMLRYVIPFASNDSDLIVIDRSAIQDTIDKLENLNNIDD